MAYWCANLKAEAGPSHGIQAEGGICEGQGVFAGGSEAGEAAHVLGKGGGGVGTTENRGLGLITPRIDADLDA